MIFFCGNLLELLHQYLWTFTKKVQAWQSPCEELSYWRTVCMKRHNGKRPFMNTKLFSSISRFSWLYTHTHEHVNEYVHEHVLNRCLKFMNMLNVSMNETQIFCSCLIIHENHEHILWLLPNGLYRLTIDDTFQRWIKVFLSSVIWSSVSYHLSAT